MEPNRTLRWRSHLEVAATTLLALASLSLLALVIWDRFRPPTPPPPAIAGQTAPAVPVEPISLDGAALRGQPNARVVLVIYSEFQCPYCGRHAREVQPEIDRQYVQTGKVLLAFRNAPLPTHRLAPKAAEAAECAGRQGRFWEMHDALFAHQEALDAPSLRDHARTLGLDLSQFDGCLSGAMTEKVWADAAAAKALSIAGTPTFFLGSKQTDGRVKVIERLTGARRLQDFQQAIDRALTGQDIER